VVELVAHDFRAPDRAADDRFIDHRPHCQRRVSGQAFLASAPDLDLAFKLGIVSDDGRCPEERAVIVDRLE
jgi:hypothetical protein